jgi:hypothetical protein
MLLITLSGTPEKEKGEPLLTEASQLSLATNMSLNSKSCTPVSPQCLPYHYCQLCDQTLALMSTILQIASCHLILRLCFSATLGWPNRELWGRTEFHFRIRVFLWDWVLIFSSNFSNIPTGWVGLFSCLSFPERECSLHAPFCFTSMLWKPKLTGSNL